MRLTEYFDQWILRYKKDVVKPVTYAKYVMTSKMLKQLVPGLTLKDIDRGTYQELMTKYAETHEHVTCMDFHHQVKPCLLDALDDGLIERDPTRRVKIGGKPAKQKGLKYLEFEEAKKLVADLNLKDAKPSWDYFIFLMINTGLRFAEGLALVPEDFDFEKMTLSVTRSWNYKSRAKSFSERFQPTKNPSSVREISLDVKTAWILKPMVETCEPKRAIFPNELGNDDGLLYSTTAISNLRRHCKRVGIPEIGIHGLRHTHASLLITKGVSIQAVAKRLGHSNTVTTQTTYIHLLKSAEKTANEQIASILVNM